MTTYVKLQIKGRNQDLLLRTLILKKINLIKIDKQSDIKCVITVAEENRRKIFAICNNMCYNVKTIGYLGRDAPLHFFKEKLPVIIGTAVFISLYIFFSGRLLSIDCTGSGKIFSDGIIAVAESCGAVKYSKLKNLDLKYAEKEILKSNPLFSFVNMKIRGNRLIINVAVNESPPEKLSETETDLYSDEEGIIESISVIRGTALVEKGDSVSKGQPLVGAYYDYMDNRFSTFVSAKVEISVTKNLYYKTELKTENALSAYKTLAIAEEKEEIKSAEAKFVSGGIMVTMTVIHIVCGG